MGSQQITDMFNPQTVSCFYFDSYEFDNGNGSVALSYRLDDIEFTELLTFPGFTPVPAELLPALDRSLKLLHVVCGISYYKAAVPPAIRFSSYALSKAEAEFYTWLYRNGLGEFAYRNDLPLADLTFPFQSEIEIEAAQPLALPPGVVVPIGGGKDSLVTATLLREAGIPYRSFVLGSFPAITRVTEAIGVPCINVSRTISPNLFELNKRGALNGHVPISAIIASTLAVTSIIYGFSTAVLSNERSADEGNLTTAGGVEVNHQFSKSYAFEKAFQRHLAESVQTPFSYFSLLRPLSELAIGQLFVRSERFDDLFTSCNRAFKLLDTDRQQAPWCCSCPKCVSTFLCLAPFMDKERLISIFGRNLLSDEALIPLYSELLGMAGHKPFECVIEYAEARAAFAYLSTLPAWQAEPVVVWAEQQSVSPTPSLNEFLAPTGADSIPDKYREVLNAAI